MQAGLPNPIEDSGGDALTIDDYLIERPSQTVLVRVKGDSMIDAGILEGDTIIVKRCEDANNGDIVVALVDEAEATLKRLRRRGDSIALEAANPAYETRIFGPDRVRVQGRLVGLIRAENERRQRPQRRANGKSNRGIHAQLFVCGQGAYCGYRREVRPNVRLPLGGLSYTDRLPTVSIKPAPKKF